MNIFWPAEMTRSAVGALSALLASQTEAILHQQLAQERMKLTEIGYQSRLGLRPHHLR